VARGECEDSDIAEPVPAKQNRGSGIPKEAAKPPVKTKPNAEIAKLKKALAKAEGRMKHFGEERDRLLKEMAENPMHYSKERNQRLKEAQIGIENAEDEWCSLQTKLDKLKQ